MELRKVKGVKIIKTPEEFAEMTVSEISRLMHSDFSYWIVGRKKGEDRHIISANHITVKNYKQANNL